MRNCLNAVACVIAFTCIFTVSADAQSFVGAGYGTYNVPGASSEFKGYCPTLTYEYLFDNMRQSVYTDVSFFKNDEMWQGASEIDNMGNIIREPDLQLHTTYLYGQAGAKMLLGEADERKIIPYLGAGFAFAFAKTKSSKVIAPGEMAGSESRLLWGFHFNAGAQYNFGALVVALRGNLDFILKPIDYNSSSSNVLKNTRLAVLIPLSHDGQ